MTDIDTRGLLCPIVNGDAHREGPASRLEERSVAVIAVCGLNHRSFK